MIYGVGTTRGGTRTLATYLNDAGFDVSYEGTCHGCRLYGNDSEAVKQLYQDLGKGDVAYVHVLALEEICEVDLDAKFVHYTRNPIDMVASLLAVRLNRRQAEGDVRGQHHSMIWTPHTGVFYAGAVVDERLECFNFAYHGPTDSGWSASLITQLAYYWQWVHKTIMKFLDGFPQDRWARVRMEQLEQDGPKMLEHFGVGASPEIKRGNKNKFFVDKLDDAGVQEVTRVAGDVMEQLGYAA